MPTSDYRFDTPDQLTETLLSLLRQTDALRLMDIINQLRDMGFPIDWNTARRFVCTLLDRGQLQGQFHFDPRTGKGTRYYSLCKSTAEATDLFATEDDYGRQGPCQVNRSNATSS